MPVPSDAFRRFQDELAALEPAKPKLTREQELLIAKTAFLELQRRHGLTVADVIGFFPPEEGVEYLRQLIDSAPTRPTARRRHRTPGGD
jgi:hypothetical protein